MAWIYLQELEESQPPCESGCDPFPIAKSNPTANPSSCKECKKGICPKHQYGMMYEPLQKKELGKPYPWISTLSTAASHEESHAKISVLQELEKAWQESEVDCFMRSLGCVASLSPDGSFWRTSQQSLLEAEQKWSGKLPKWGMTVDGALYPLHPSEPVTDEIDGSYCVGTPRASQASKLIRKQTPNERHGESTQDSIGRLNPELIGKKLCPQWVDVLMGYQIGWSGLDALETASSHNRSGKLL